MAPAEVSSVKVVFIGDGAVGKTCVLVSYIQNAFPEDYVPTVFDNFTAKAVCTIDGMKRTVDLSLWDTAGQEEYDALRPLSYPGTDIFVIVFAVHNPDSFENVKAKWIGKVSHHCPGTPVILVGNKTDLRTDEIIIQSLAAKGQCPVTYKEGMALAKQIGAKKYVECSAKNQDNVRGVFDEILNEHFKAKAETNGGTSFSTCCWKGGEPDQSRIRPISTE